MTINITSEKIFKALHILLLVAIFGLLLWSKPWDTTSSSTAERKITVTGESIIEEQPDEFTFYPYFQETGTDQDAMKASLTKKANEAVDKLKEMGVGEEDMSLDASSYDRWYYDEDEEGTLNIRLTITTADDKVVQDVQDYLLTLDVKGQISPQATFSKSKQKELDDRAVEEAINDAKAKAQKQAQLFNAKLGDVITVNQGSDSIFYGYGQRDFIALEASESISASLPVLPGQEEYRQTVTVEYELR